MGSLVTTQSLISVQRALQAHADDTTNVHGMPDTGRLFYATVGGYFDMADATTPPVGVPASGHVFWWVESGQLKFRDHDGQEVTLLPSWDNPFGVLGADVSKTSDVTTAVLGTGVDQCSLPLAANAWYIIRGQYFYQGGAGGAKIGLAGPTDLEGDYGVLGYPAAIASLSGVMSPFSPGGLTNATSDRAQLVTGSNAVSRGSISGSTHIARIEGLFRTVSAGNLKMSGAQATSSGTATVFKENSWLHAQRVA